MLSSYNTNWTQKPFNFKPLTLPVWPLFAPPLQNSCASAPVTALLTPTSMQQLTLFILAHQKDWVPLQLRSDGLLLGRASVYGVCTRMCVCLFCMCVCVRCVCMCVMRVHLTRGNWGFASKNVHSWAWSRFLQVFVFCSGLLACAHCVNCKLTPI